MSSAQVRIRAGVCENVASDLGLSGSFRQVFKDSNNPLFVYFLMNSRLMWMA